MTRKNHPYGDAFVLAERHERYPVQRNFRTPTTLEEFAARARSISIQQNIGSDFTEEEIAFMDAMDAYKRQFKRPFPHWSEVLAVLKNLGYTKGPVGQGRAAGQFEAPAIAEHGTAPGHLENE